MKVDMSPEAVSGRLQAMGELWQLSVELMTSKPADGESFRSGRQRALEIQDSIRRVLLRYWDPIGVADVPEANDEYDSYISPVYRVLVGSRSIEDLVECLRRIERDEMGVGPTDCVVLRGVAEKLLDVEVRLS